MRFAEFHKGKLFINPKRVIRYEEHGGQEGKTQIYFVDGKHLEIAEDIKVVTKKFEGI